jgi:hypothetical protein
LGNGAVAGKDGDVALGGGAVADRGAQSYAGKYSEAQNKSAGTVSVGSSGAERTLSNLADGREATDAVNLRQLDGALKQANAYTDKRLQDVAGNVLHVGDQLTALDERMTGIEGDVTNIGNGAAGMFQTSQEVKATRRRAARAPWPRVRTAPRSAMARRRPAREPRRWATAARRRAVMPWRWARGLSPTATTRFRSARPEPNARSRTWPAALREPTR